VTDLRTVTSAITDLKLARHSASPLRATQPLGDRLPTVSPKSLPTAPSCQSVGKPLNRLFLDFIEIDDMLGVHIVGIIIPGTNA
jgi:hypothetical protein